MKTSYQAHIKLTRYSAATSGDMSSELVAFGKPSAVAMISPSVRTSLSLSVEDCIFGPCRHPLATSERSTFWRVCVSATTHTYILVQPAVRQTGDHAAHLIRSRSSSQDLDQARRLQYCETRPAGSTALLSVLVLSPIDPLLKKLLSPSERQCCSRAASRAQTADRTGDHLEARTSHQMQQAGPTTIAFLLRLGQRNSPALATRWTRT